MKATNYIKWLWAASEGAKTGIAAGSVIGTVRIAANFVFIWSSKTLVDIATGHSDAGLYMHMAILAGCMALQIALSAAGTRISVSTEIRMKNRLRHMLFTRILESRWAGREAMHTGDMLSRLEGDVRTVSDAVCKTIPATMVTSLQLAAAIVILARLDWRLALCTVAIMPAALLISRSHRQIGNIDGQILPLSALYGTGREKICRATYREGSVTEVFVSEIKTIHHTLASRIRHHIGFGDARQPHQLLKIANPVFASKQRKSGH